LSIIILPDLVKGLYILIKVE